MKRIGRALAALALVASASVVGGDRVHAGSGLNQWAWHAPNLAVSSGSYRYSNMSGFVQALVNSNGCNLAVDGNFGNFTTWYLAAMQNGVLGYNNGGVMTPSMWYAFQAAGSVYGTRLSYEGYANPYATEYWSYYGGGALNAALGWNYFAAQWYFSPTPNANRDNLVAATPNRSIGSTPACT